MAVYHDSVGVTKKKKKTTEAKSQVAKDYEAKKKKEEEEKKQREAQQKANQRRASLPTVLAKNANSGEAERYLRQNGGQYGKDLANARSMIPGAAKTTLANERIMLEQSKRPSALERNPYVQTAVSGAAAIRNQTAPDAATAQYTYEDYTKAMRELERQRAQDRLQEAKRRENNVYRYAKDYSADELSWMQQAAQMGAEYEAERAAQSARDPRLAGGNVYQQQNADRTMNEAYRRAEAAEGRAAYLQAAKDYRESAERDAVMQGRYDRLPSDPSFKNQAALGKQRYERTIDQEAYDGDPNEKLSKRPADMLVGEKKEIFYALYAQDPQKAQEYAEYTFWKDYQAEMDKAFAWAGQNPLTRGTSWELGRRLGQAAGFQPFTTTGRMMAMMGQALSGGSAQGLQEHGLLNMGDTGKAAQLSSDPYVRALGRRFSAQSLAGTLPEDIEVIGGDGPVAQGINKSISALVGGKGLADVSQLASSMLTSYENAMLTGAFGMLGEGMDPAQAENVAKVGEAIGLALMGSSAAASDYAELMAKGVDQKTAMLHATAAGVAEAAFEKLSLENIIHMRTDGGLKQLLENWFIQAGVEASEETFTTMANRVTDEIIMDTNGYYSAVQERQHELLVQGVPYAEAKAQAEREWLVEILNDALGGFLSGGGMTAMNTVQGGIANIQERIEARNERNTMREWIGSAAANEQNAELQAALDQYARENKLKGYDQAQIEQVREWNRQQSQQATEEAQSTAKSEREVRRETARGKKAARNVGKVTQAVLNDIEQKTRGKVMREYEADLADVSRRYKGLAETVRETAYNASSDLYGTAQSVRELDTLHKDNVQGVKNDALRQAAISAYNDRMEQLAPKDSRADARWRARQAFSNGALDLAASYGEGDGRVQTQIDGITEDGKKVKLANGEVKTVDELELDTDTQDILTMLTTRGLGSVANNVLAEYQAQVKKGDLMSGYGFATDFIRAVEYGRTNQKLSDVQAALKNIKDKRTVEVAWKLGREQAQKQAEAGRRSTAAKAQTGRKASYQTVEELLGKEPDGGGVKSATGRKGSVDVSRIKGMQLDAAQTAQVQMAKTIARAIGVDVSFFASEADENGRYHGAQGSYRNGVIELDINAGRLSTLAMKSGILKTMSHELTHFIQDYSADLYQELKDFAFLVLGEKAGVGGIEELIDEKVARSGEKISRQDAEDEVIADAMETMLGSSEAVKQLYAQNATLADKVLSWLADFMRTVKAAIGPADHREAQIIDELDEQMRKVFQDKWDTALADAANRLAGETGNEKTAREGGKHTQKSERAAQNSEREDAPVTQEISSAGTSIKQIPALFTDSRVKFGGVNIDIGGGKFDLATNYLKDKFDTKNLVFDPYNRTEPVNRSTLKYLQDGNRADTATCANVLNVIAELGARKNVILEAAKAIKPDGTAYFMVYEGDGSGHGKKTSAGWQNNRKTATYVSEIEQYFNDVQRKGKLIIATNPKTDLPQASWEVQPGKAVRYSERDSEYLELAKDPEKNRERLQEMVDEAAREAGYTYRRNTRNRLNAENSSGSPIRMFVLDADGYTDLGNYGKYRYTATDAGALHAADILDDLLQLARDYYEENGIETSDLTEESVNPSDIVMSAMMWDDADFVQYAWDNYFEAVYDRTDQIPALETEDGLIVFGDDNARIKSLDPVTYDDDGNVIPLSERFNPEKEDIRYSERDESLLDDRELAQGLTEKDAQNEEQRRLLRDVKAKERQISELTRKYEKLQAEVKGYEGENPSRISVGDFTRNVLDDFSIPSGMRTATKEMLETTAEHVLSGGKLTDDDIFGLFSYLVSNGRTKSVTDETLANIRDDLKGRRIYVNEETREDFGDDWADFRRRAFGLGIYLTTNQKDPGFDTVNMELADEYPGFFDANETDARMALENILDTANSGKTTDISLLDAVQENERMTGEPATEQLQAMMDKFKRHIDIMQDRARLEARARAGNASELANAKERAKKAESKLEEIRKERDSWKGKAERANRRIDKDLRKIVVKDARQITAAVQQKQRVAKQLEKQIQREKDILSGKLRAPQMVQMLKQERERVTEQKNEQIRKMRESRKVSELRKRIKNLADDLKRRMVRPTDGAYVPASLYQSMTELADALDSVLAPSPGSKADARYRSIMNAIHAFSDEYGAMKDLDDAMISSEYDPEIQDDIVRIVNTLRRKDVSWVAEIAGEDQYKLGELGLGELQKIYDLMKCIRDKLRDATKLIGKTNAAHIRDYGASIIADEQQIKQRKDGKKAAGRLANTLASNVQIDALSPMRAVKMIGGWSENSALYELWRDIEDGNEIKNDVVMEANKTMQPFRTGKNEKTYLDALRKKMDFGIKDTSNKTVRMTKLQAIQLYMTWQREANNDKLVHLQKGFASIRDADLIANGKSKQAAKTAQNVKVTPEMIAKIEKSFTEWDKGYIKAARDVFHRILTDSNKVQYALRHTVMHGEEYYIPITVDENYLTVEPNKEDVTQIGVKNPGSTKPLETRSGKPVIIDGLDVVLNKHISDMSGYIGLAVPIRNFVKVWNVSQDDANGDRVTVKSAISGAWGDKANDMMMETLKQIQNMNSGHYATGLDAISRNLNSAFAKSALVGRPSVVIKQAASYAAAGSVLKQSALDTAQAVLLPVFLSPNSKFARNIYERADRLTSELYMRRLGMSMVEIAQEKLRTGPVKRLTDQIGASLEQNAFGRVVRRASAWLNPGDWIQRMDVATTTALFVACEHQAKSEKLKPNTDAFDNRVRELYNQVITQTQPMYDPLYRNQLQKSKVGSTVQAMFPFKTVPFQNYGQIMDSIGSWQEAMRSGDKEQKKQASKHMAKTMYANFLSALVFAGLTILGNGVIMHKMKKWRDDDDELTAASLAAQYAKDVGDVMLSNLLPYGGSELKEIVERLGDGGNKSYFDVFSIGTLDLLNDTAKSIFDAWEAWGDKDASMDTKKDKLAKMVLEVTTMFGLPVRNIVELKDGIAANIRDIQNGNFPALNNDVDRSNSVNANRYYEAMLDGDEEKAAAVLEEMRANTTGTQKEINQKVRNAINDRAKEDYKIGEMDLDEYISFLESTGLWESDALAEKAVGAVKELYNDGKLTEDEAIDLLGKYKGLDEDEAWFKVQEWEDKAQAVQDALDAGLEADQAEDVSTSKYRRVYDAIDANADASEAIQDLIDHGMDKDAVTKKVKEYLRDQYVDGVYTEQKYKNYLSRYAGITGQDANDALADAKNRVRAKEFEEKHPELDWTMDNITAYYDKVPKTVISKTPAQANIPVSTFDLYLTNAKTVTGTDKDHDGKTDSGSLKQAYIYMVDKLPGLSNEQKELLLRLKYDLPTKSNEDKEYDIPWHKK